MIALVILVIVNVMILMRTGQAPIEDGEKWTIYGSMGCGWTRKQIEYMKKNGKSYTFVDCEEEDCPGVEGFPTMVDQNGERVVGFKEV
ncbi:hypothetical protein FK873_gp072 [Micromonas pusilla virus SP1]|jgi:hypothetical protein|uniref:Glutaredoxin domain-containing protein n=1 Tax=Micromonas pusilla virus SP1 TaxID=373996 RepID=G9E643_MPSP1|nr:hypothetical protein FK873_gp072 [Micromonas pusilla virus SP1]AET84870.1 hypothetical protein MPXG_00072 [Micromonas pusilla virus SP1]